MLFIYLLKIQYGLLNQNSYALAYVPEDCNAQTDEFCKIAVITIPV